MKKTILFIALGLSFLSVAQAQRAVYINDVKLKATVLQQLEQTYQTTIPNGHYWYDRLSGAWGFEGGPAQGIIPANLNIGGTLKRNASGGKSGVFINGRELHTTEARYMQALFGAYYKNRFWLDAYGNLGLEGNIAIVNLYQLMQQQQQQNQSYYRHNDYLDHSSGGNSSGFYIMGKDWSYSSF